MPSIASSYGPHDIGSDGYRALAHANYCAGLVHITGMMRDGASAADVAAYVQGFGLGSVGLSHMIEDQAADGTFAAAVFDILCGD